MSKTATTILTVSLLVVLIAAIVLKTFFIGYYRIPQNGMYPGLPAGARVFANLRAYSKPSDVKRGDLVVFNHDVSGARYVYVWRVVGLPGERIETSGETIRIDGQAVQRERVREADGKMIFREQLGDASFEVAFAPTTSSPPDAATTLSADQFFVMGDNRFEAADSRHSGPISFTSIVGRKL